MQKMMAGSMPSKPLYFQWKNKHEILLPMKLSHLLLSQNALFIELIFLEVIYDDTHAQDIRSRNLLSRVLVSLGPALENSRHVIGVPARLDHFLPLFHDAFLFHSHDLDACFSLLGHG